MGGGLVGLTWHPSWFSLSTLPTLLPSLPTPNPPNNTLVGCVASFVVGCVLVLDERLGDATCRVWRSFKLRPFSIAISNFIVAYFTGLLKS